MRTTEEKAKHAEYERKYRAQKRADRDAALVRFGDSAATLIRDHKFTPGQLLDLMMKLVPESSE